MKSRKAGFKELKKDFSKSQWYVFIQDRRRTGNTAGHLLGLISLAMATPNVKVAITDNVPGWQNHPEVNSKRQLRLNVLPMLIELIDKLKLEDFKINKTDLTLTYDLSWLK